MSNQEDFNKRLNDLVEREREIIKKMNVALRAGASSSIIQQIQFMLEDCKAQQQEIRMVQKSKESGKDDFDDFLSIG